MPSPLSLNQDVVFRGEAAWPPATLTTKEAKALMASVNPCGRPNEDVLRRRFILVDGAPRESWQIDFPVHFTDQEAALYEQPFARLAKAGWRNPHANPALRRALARVSRYLVWPDTSRDAEAGRWTWIEEDLIPDAALLVVARDDDFTHGVLQSSAFAAWQTAHRGKLEPATIVESFPFPWPPGTALSALSAAQEEKRHALARAARSGDPEAIDRAVADAYGWPADLDAPTLVARLAALHPLR